MSRALIALPLLLALSSLTSAHAQRKLSLADAVDLACKQDPLMAEAKIAVDRSKLAVLRAQLDRFSVKVDASVNELWSKSNIAGPQINNCAIGGSSLPLDPVTCAAAGGSVGPQSPESLQGLSNLKAQVNVPIFSGFQVESNVAMRQRLEDVSTASLRDTRRQTALAVARAYWAVRRVAILRDAQAAAAARLTEAETVTDARVKAGLAAPIDHNRALLSKLSRAATVADLDGQVHESTVQLAILLGTDDDIVLTDSVEGPNVPSGLPPTIDELMKNADGARPDLRRAEFQLAAQKQNVRIAFSNYYPQLSAFGLFQIGNNQLNFGSGVRSTSSVANPFDSMSGSLTLGLSLNVNLFDTLNTYTSVKDARYEEARLWQERRLAERTVSADVRAAHAKVLHLASRRVPLIAALDVARDNLVILEGRYKNGDALVIEYLQAQVDLSDAELNLADVMAQLRLAWLELDAALGRVPGEPS